MVELRCGEVVVAIAVLLASLALAADDGVAGDGVDYVRDIKPMLAARCYACHGALKQKSGLRLDTAVLARAGGDSGAAIVPGSATESLLIERVSAPDAADRMPPEGPPLSAREIDLLRAWIDAGAAAPEAERPEAEITEHWAFRSLERPPVPGVDAPASAHPIDRFIAARQREKGLKANAAAAPRVVLRRLYLDLTGLPPTRDALAALARDERADAYERVVDRLLASPRYGERWARHWMDVWRYSDWYGLGAQLRYSQKHIWRWRDWIVESLNADKGYDRMVLEMLAADELAPTDTDALRATGFLARNYFLFNRTTWLDATIEHTSKAFLGLTMNCARCHDHKYDPILQVDYYRLRAVFEPHQVRLDPVPGETNLEKDGLARVFDAHPEAPTFLYVRGDAKEPDTSRRLEPGVPEALAFEPLEISPVDLPPEAFHPALQPFVLRDQLNAAEADIATARAALEAARAQLESAARAVRAATGEAPQAAAPEEASAAELAQRQRAVRLHESAVARAALRPAALRAAHAADTAKHRSPPAAHLPQLIAAAARAAREYELALAEERLWRAEDKLATATGETRPAAEKEREEAARARAEAGRALASPGERYTSLRASLKALEGPDETEESRRNPYPRASTGRRAALARWITHRRNPLTARVAVNHIWTRHFGRPLVASVTDFGLRAPRPPLQPLLDWLAVELMESGWSMKQLHRLIVTSEAYRRASSTAGADARARASDPGNHLYWRGERKRMESQVIRDSLLAHAGLLDLALGGPSIDSKHEETVFRRSLYFTHSRDERGRFVAMFDDADILACYRRTESIVPQQALTLANSRLGRDVARAVAARLERELGAAGDAGFARVAYETILAVEPTAAEIAACVEALEATRSVLTRLDAAATARARENLVHALLNHNDFITIR